MSKAIAEDSNSSAALAAQIASEIIDKIELWQKNANDFNELLRNCDTLAEFAHKSTNTIQTNLLFAETSILQGKIFLTPFSPDENDVTWLRVQARLLMAQEKFEQSAKLWAKIAELRRNETSAQTQKSYGTGGRPNFMNSTALPNHRRQTSKISPMLSTCFSALTPKFPLPGPKNSIY